jgi:integrase
MSEASQPQQTHRRGNGEGSVYQRKDGRWVAAVSVGGTERKSLYGKTKKDVLEKKTKALRDLQQGVPLPNDRRTLGQFLAIWLESSVKGHVRPSTYISYEGLVRLHIAPQLGAIPLTKLSVPKVQAFLKSKTDAGYSAKRVHHMLAVLRQALKVAEQWGEVARNVANLAKGPKLTHTPVNPFSLKEAQSFLAAAMGDRLEALFAVALAVGLRRGEALGLQWKDVDLNGGTLTVSHALQRIDGTLQLVPPKSEASRRTIALPGITLACLKSHKVRQVEERIAAGAHWTDTGFVFTTTVGTPLDGDNVTKRYKRILKEAGLRDQRFHDLRHCCGTLLVAQGVHPRAVMEILGHSQIAVTMDLYAHVLPEVQREAMDKMDAILTRETGA